MKSNTRVWTAASAAALLLVAGAWIGLVQSVRAVESQDADDVTSEAPVTNDLLTAGRTVHVQRQIPGDLAAAGRSVTIDAPVQGYVMSAGQTVTLTGAIGNDLWAAGEVVDVGSDVGNNVIAAGRRVHLRPGAVIGHDATIGGESVLAEGRIEHNLRIGAATARIGGEIGGAVNAHARHVIVLPGAVVRGDLTVRGPDPPEIAPDAQVLGQVRHEAPPPAAWWSTWPIWWLCTFLAMLILGLVVLAVSRTWTERVASTMREHWGASLFSGLLLLVGGPILIGLLAVTLIGIPLALVVLAMYLLALLLASVFVSYRVGDWLLDRLHRTQASPWGRMTLGALVVSLAMVAPAVGWLICLAVLVAGAGALVLERRTARAALAGAGAS